MGKEKNNLWPAALSSLLLFLLPLLAGLLPSSDVSQIGDRSWLFQVSMVCLLVLTVCMLGLVGWRDWLGYQQKKWDLEKNREDQQELLAWLDKALLRTASTATAIENETQIKRLENLIGRVKDQLSSVKTDAPRQKAENRLERLFDQMECILNPEGAVTTGAANEKKARTNKSKQ